MAEVTEQRLGFGLGLLGGVLIGLGGIVSLLLGTADLILGHPIGALNAASEGVLLLVIGGLALLFSWLGHRSWSGHPITSGVMLILVAVIGWIVVGIGSSLLGLVGSLFVFLAGVLYLLDPAQRAIRVAVSTP
jgi:hypothetical protein